MINMRFRMNFRKSHVMSVMRREERRYLFRVGAFVRKTMMRLMPVRKRPSAVGRPPHSHTKRLKRSIRFAVEDAGVIVGPLRAWSKLRGSKPGPALLDQGGWATRRDKGAAAKPIRIRRRPFRGPALERSRPEFGKLWRGRSS